MSSQLLGELLLDRHNFTIMTKYISKPENLKLMMNLLRDKSRNIQFEAFHVFKVEYEDGAACPHQLGALAHRLALSARLESSVGC